LVPWRFANPHVNPHTLAERRLPIMGRSLILRQRPQADISREANTGRTSTQTDVFKFSSSQAQRHDRTRPEFCVPPRFPFSAAHRAGSLGRGLHPRRSDRTRSSPPTVCMDGKKLCRTGSRGGAPLTGGLAQGRAYHCDGRRRAGAGPIAGEHGMCGGIGWACSARGFHASDSTAPRDGPVVGQASGH